MPTLHHRATYSTVDTSGSGQAGCPSYGEGYLFGNTQSLGAASQLVPISGRSVFNKRGELQMSEPTIAAKKPAILELEPGDYYWCSCGQSSNQPYCDGSHAGTEFTPLKFSVEEKKQVALCQCKKTNNPPFCDGTHSQL